MILFGRKDKVIGTRELPSEVCEECGKRGGIVSVFQIYYHIATLPFIPLSRRTASQCYSCRKVKLEKNFSEQQKSVSDLMKKDYKTPYWTFAGAGLIMLYIIINFVLKTV